MRLYISAILCLIVSIPSFSQDILELKLAPIVLPTERENGSNAFRWINADDVLSFWNYNGSTHSGPDITYKNTDEGGTLWYVYYNVNGDFYETLTIFERCQIEYIVLGRSEISNPYEGIPYYSSVDNLWWYKGHEYEMLTIDRRKSDNNNPDKHIFTHEIVHSASGDFEADGETMKIIDRW